MEIKKLILACGSAAFIFCGMAEAKVKIHTKYNSLAYQQKEKEKKQDNSFRIDLNKNTSNSQNEERLSRKIDRLQDRIDELKDTIRELRKEGAAKDRHIETLIEKNNKLTEKLLKANNQN